MAYAWVADNFAEFATSDSTVAVMLNGVTAGNLLVVTISIGNADARTISSVADGTNTYNAVTNVYSAIISWRQWMYYCVPGTGGNLTITATFSGAVTGGRAIMVTEYSGGHATPLDGTNYTTVDAEGNADGTETIGPLTPSENDCLLVASLADGTVTAYGTPINGYTIGQDSDPDICNVCQLYLIQTTAAESTAGATGNAWGSYCGCMAVFKAAAAAGGAAGGGAYYQHYYLSVVT